jgi:Icc-related predicted phosphoesterase
MKICCASDLHGHLPKVPECDLLLLGGDYCPANKTMQYFWFAKTFAPWLKEISDRVPVIGVSGNHDWMFEDFGPEDWPILRWTYLQDSGTEFQGLKIWGTPWQPRFYDWAFNMDEPDLEKRWALIPDDTDILLLHGPPYGYGDFSPHGHEHTGSPSLLKKIEEIKPKLVVAGHIHAGYGRYNIGETVFINAAHVNEQYKPVNALQIVEL